MTFLGQKFRHVPENGCATKISLNPTDCQKSSIKYEVYFS